MTDIIFPEGSVPVRIVAKVYGKDPCWVREGIIQGWLPIGVANKRKGCKRYNFFISPKKLYLETGYLWNGKR